MQDFNPLPPTYGHYRLNQYRTAKLTSFILESRVNIAQYQQKKRCVV